MINHEEFYLKSIDGLGLFAQTWSNNSSPKALVCLVHGLGDHSSRFEYWAKLFVKNGFAVTAFDLRGNGKSQGKRGYTPSYEILLKDISIFLKKSRGLFPSIPIFLYGHSLGGNLIINYVIRKNPDIQGLIITSPWLKLNYEPSNLRKRFGKIINRLMPWYTISSGLSREDFNGNNPVINNFDEDKFLHNRISVRLYLDAYKNGIWALKNIYKVNVPLLIMYGKEDKITSYKTCEDYVNNTSDKTKLIVWNEARHNLHNSPVHLKIHQSIIKWLKENCIIANTNVTANEFIPH